MQKVANIFSFLFLSPLLGQSLNMLLIKDIVSDDGEPIGNYYLILKVLFTRIYKVNLW